MSNVQPTPSLLLHAFDKQKVHFVDVHPVKPWVVLGQKTGNLILYDYNQHTIIHSFSLNMMYDSKKEEVQLMKALEKTYQNISLPDFDPELLKITQIGFDFCLL